MIQTYACHVRYKFCLINFVFYNILGNIDTLLIPSNELSEPCIMFSHFFDPAKSKLMPKIYPAFQSSVNMSVLLFVTDIIFFMTTPAWKAEHQNNFQMKIWHDSLKHSHSQDSLQEQPCEGWNTSQRLLQESAKTFSKLHAHYWFYIPGRLSGTAT